MSNGHEKIEKLIQAARLYYEEDYTQNDIAKIFGVSRPMISKLLKEAKEMGIVKIEITAPILGNAALIQKAKERFQLKGGICLPLQNNDNLTNETLAKAAVAYLESLQGKRLGIGWGTIIGKVGEVLEQRDEVGKIAQSICPLIGNSGVSTRNYHSNELVRIFAQYNEALPAYLYAPAFVGTEQEFLLIQDMENYQEISRKWDKLDMALVNIGNYPSVPDYASGARYGNLLQEEKAVGRVLTYFYNREGEIIRSDTDYAIKIPLEKLSRIKNVVGICSANTTAEALVGALRCGLIQHIIAPEEVLKKSLEI